MTHPSTERVQPFLRKLWWSLWPRQWRIQTPYGDTWDTLGRYTYWGAKRRFTSGYPLHPL